MAYNDSLSALADPTRRALFEAIANCPSSVGDLARRHPISRPAVSQHLKVLQQAQLVTARPEGTRRIYEIDRRGLDALRSYLDQFWTDALDAFSAEVARRTPKT